MKLFHGSNTSNIKVLKPNLADHDRPYVYMVTNPVVAAFYLCNAVDRPYYWFPYGFTDNGITPVYHELYPDALKEVSEEISGYIYEAWAEEDQVIPFKNIPGAWFATEPVNVTGCIKVDNAYKLFMEYIKQGKMQLGDFKSKTPEQMEWWYLRITEYMEEKNMVKTPECPYACLIRKKFPGVWEKYMTGKYREEG